MRAVIQRVKYASVKIGGETEGRIDNGLLVFIGVGPDDDNSDVKYIVDKTTNLRIFEDENEKMNFSVRDVCGSILVVSQFTLFGDCRKGRRPDFTSSCEPKKAKDIYESAVREFKNSGLNIECGIFGADMKIELLNDGPVTILLDSKKLF